MVINVENKNVRTYPVLMYRVIITFSQIFSVDVTYSKSHNYVNILKITRSLNYVHVHCQIPTTKIKMYTPAEDRKGA